MTVMSRTLKGAGRVRLLLIAAIVVLALGWALAAIGAPTVAPQGDWRDDPWDFGGRLVQPYVGLGNDGRDDTPCGPEECP
jgi:hypothetical protein